MTLYASGVAARRDTPPMVGVVAHFACGAAGQAATADDRSTRCAPNASQRVYLRSVPTSLVRGNEFPMFRDATSGTRVVSVRRTTALRPVASTAHGLDQASDESRQQGGEGNGWARHRAGVERKRTPCAQPAPPRVCQEQLTPSVTEHRGPIARSHPRSKALRDRGVRCVGRLVIAVASKDVSPSLRRVGSDYARRTSSCPAPSAHRVTRHPLGSHGVAFRSSASSPNGPTPSGHSVRGRQLNPSCHACAIPTGTPSRDAAGTLPRSNTMRSHARTAPARVSAGGAA